MEDSPEKGEGAKTQPDSHPEMARGENWGKGDTEFVLSFVVVPPV